MPNGQDQKLFGTDGIRGVAGEFPLDPRTVAIIGQSLVSNLARTLGHSPRIVIGRDTRESGPEIEAALARGIIDAGASVDSAGIITTPGVAYITKSAGFDAGVVISASHNPYQDNGIKVFSPSGKKLEDEMERRIEADIFVSLAGETQTDDRGDWLSNEGTHEKKYQERYLDYLVGQVARGLRLDGTRLAIDCANGAASTMAPELFRRLGANVIPIGDKPDGRNINEGCGSLFLETLQSLVSSESVDAGIAFDGDADRALFVDSNAKLIDGDVALLILADYLARQGKLTGNTVVATVMSNIGLELALRKREIKLIRAQVGDRFVLQELLARNASLGGEQSGHIIFPDISLAGDGMITAIELLRAVQESGKNLAELSSQMTRFPQVLVNVRVSSKPPLDSIPEIEQAISRLAREIAGNGRLLVRYSGTENLARIMIEGRDEKEIKSQANHLAEIIRQSIG